jgi:hypothetical protein
VSDSRARVEKSDYRRSTFAAGKTDQRRRSDQAACDAEELAPLHPITSARGQASQS